MILKSHMNQMEKDGIWFIDRVTEKIELLLSYEELLEDLPFKYSNNILNHLSFSPNNNFIVWFLINENKIGRKIYIKECA